MESQMETDLDQHYDPLIDDTLLTIQILFLDPWKYGYPVDCLRLSFWLLTLDNLIKPKLPEEFQALEATLSKERTLRNILRKIHHDQSLQSQALTLLPLLLAQVDLTQDSHRKCLQEIRNFSFTKCLFGPWFHNQFPEKSTPPEANLRMRLYNFRHWIRWKTGHRYSNEYQILNVGAEWTPDLQAICEFNDLIICEELPLRKGYSPVHSILPLNTSTSVEVNHLGDLYGALVDPSRNYRSPAAFHPGVSHCVDTLFGLNLEEISQNPILYKIVTDHMEKSSTYMGRDHLFHLPWQLGDPHLPKPTVTFDEPIFRSLSFRSKRNETYISLKNVLKGFSKISISLSRERKSAVDYVEPKIEPEKEERPSEVKAELMSIRRKAKLMQTRRLNNIRYFYSVDSRLNALDGTFQDYEEDPFVDGELLEEVFEGSEEWKNNPTGYALLCKRLILLSDQVSMPEYPDLNQFETLFEEASKRSNPQPIQTILDTCSTIASNIDEERTSKILSAAKELPVIKQALTSVYYNSIAKKLIRENKWDLLGKMERAELGKESHRKHLQEIAGMRIDQFLKRDTMSPNEIKTLSKLTLDLMEQLIVFLQNDTSEKPLMESLKSNLSRINSKHRDRLSHRLEDMDSDLILECQIWLQYLCAYIHVTNAETYWNILNNVEELFDSVWKKIEQNLLGELVV